ncbi:MAG: type I-E CRISPR-associated protein Cse2/CasB [Polynucleobacter sp.]|uniref:type I-E CRISPR-associated protein Cse2/CasB n=1 Tax=Polynucleobacter sp. TaxID=2029855 RepID=UPI00271C7E6A|nr:type I-E CRISPR-associated protein Cse2/CasB [Polynucleobacter sp.]MDO8714008.1 type I-E CRISPR-associated protein Cse2/CasB [Polynucleobacter sp.]
MREHTKAPVIARANKAAGFVAYVIDRCQVENGLRAALKRADNPATEYQSWEVLAGFKINLEHENERLPFAAIAATIARAKIEKNGTIQIGQAIARCYEDGSNSDQAKAKLRRLLACDSVSEVCRILRPLFSLIEAKGQSGLDYARLLDDLLWFGHDERQTRIKARWAQSFYDSVIEEKIDA